MKGIIYIATNKINGKQYVGQTIKSLNQRKYKHEYDAVNRPKDTCAFHLALVKYGNTAFEWNEACAVYGKSKKEVISKLNKLEIFMIQELETIADYGKGYNCDFGGNSTPKSEITKKRLSEAHKGKKLTDAHKKKIAENTKKALNKPETKLKMCEAMTGENNPFFGKKHSEETKKKIGEASKGRDTGRSKAINAYLNGEFVGTFKSGAKFVKYAEEELGIKISRQMVSNVLNGYKKHTKGYTFTFAN